MQKNKFIAVIGNTGVGKSKLAIELAKKFQGQVVNADSLQVYRGVDVITNKHPVEEREVPHHLLGHVEWSEQYTVKHFENEATPLIARLNASQQLPVLVGGTHYYIQSLISDELIGELGSSHLTEEQTAVLDDPAQVSATLEQVDPKILQKFHPNDTRRLRRALEIYFTTGKPSSDIYAAQSENLSSKYNVLIFWVHCERETLKKRLDDRVDEMMHQNLLDEIRQLNDFYSTGVPLNTSVLQAIGFRQFLPWLESPSVASLEASLDAMKSATTQYARKQTKWIVNKFFPQLDKMGARYAVVDSTDLDWEGMKERAFNITQEWLDGTQVTPLLLENVDCGRKAGTFDWVRHECKYCDAVLVGTEAWNVHLGSKQHRYKYRAATQPEPEYKKRARERKEQSNG